MGVVVDRLGAWLLDAGGAAAVWLSLVMLAMVACRQPIYRRDLARVGVVGALLLVPLSLLPIEQIGLRGPRPKSFGPFVATWAESIIGRGIGQAMTVAYVGVVMAGFGWSLIGGWAMRRMIRSSVGASAEAMALYDGLSFEGRAGRRPVLRVSGRIGRPALVGCLRTAIVIPDAWDRPGPGSAERLRLGLLHELVHAERNDAVFHWLGRLSQAIWFALPPMWWLRRQMEIDQEVLADERTARRLGSAMASYAATLVKMAGAEGWPSSSDEGPSRVTIDSDGSPLVRRVAMLVRCPFPIESTAPAWWRLGLPPAAVCMVLVASRLTFAEVPARSQPDQLPAVMGAFHLKELAIAPAAVPPELRLPAPLPRRFEVTMTLRADPALLGEIAIAGYRLGPPTGHDWAADAGHEVWHQIRLVVDDGEAMLWVDDLPARAVIDPTSPTAWLSFRTAAGRSTHVRDLILAPVESSDATASRPTGTQVSAPAPRPGRRRGPS